MNEKEFRIWNIFEPTDGSGPTALVTANDLKAWGMGAVYGKPVVLTSKMLEKLGFEEFAGGQREVTVVGLKSSGIIKFSFEGMNGKYYPAGGLNELKYLHQLQNLYFALTGEELEIKPLNHEKTS